MRKGRHLHDPGIRRLHPFTKEVEGISGDQHGVLRRRYGLHLGSELGAALSNLTAPGRDGGIERHGAIAGRA